MENNKNQGNTEGYNQKVPVYNSLAEEINTKSGNLENLIANYNEEVSIFNNRLAN